MLLRRKLLDGVAFDETLMQSADLDFMLRIIEPPAEVCALGSIGVFYRKNHGSSIIENRRQVQQEEMKALFRARRRQVQPGPVFLPDGRFSLDHMPELLTWVSRRAPEPPRGVTAAKASCARSGSLPGLTYPPHPDPCL